MSPIKYGSKKHVWSPEFITYMDYIVKQPAYKGMPDSIDDENKIQWEAPSNRSGGKYKDTHVRRLNWWKLKAKAVGIDIRTEFWISRVAKKIHPTGEKPCKKCGNVMVLNYSYPQSRLLKKINSIPLVEECFEFEDFITINELVESLYKKYGNQILPFLAEAIRNSSDRCPIEGITYKKFVSWLEIFIKSEPRGCLSPGAMSNAPDRFDGFHSFNLCCRSKADTGRTKENLQTYTTDRRVFENWNQGNWIAADRLMGKVRTILKNEPCRFGHPGPCDADHIGPISLGFCHRPKFQLLCPKCNSAKNNKMSHDDVKNLIKDEKLGDQVVSWHTSCAWNLVNAKVKKAPDALKASKILRDFSFYPLEIFYLLLKEGKFTFLLSMLELQYADWDIDFDELGAKNYITNYKEMKQAKRSNKYAKVQKARRIRIAFTHLLDFIQKENRQVFRVEGWNKKLLEGVVLNVSKILKNSAIQDKELQLLFSELKIEQINAGNFHMLEKYIDKLSNYSKEINEAKVEIDKYLSFVALQLVKMWDTDRYNR